MSLVNHFYPKYKNAVTPNFSEQVHLTSKLVCVKCSDSMTNSDSLRSGSTNLCLYVKIFSLYSKYKLQSASSVLVSYHQHCLVSSFSLHPPIFVSPLFQPLLHL